MGRERVSAVGFVRMIWFGIVLRASTPMALLVAVLVIFPSVRRTLPEQISGVQTTIYVALAGIAGTLLGFSLAASTFLISLAEDRPLLKRMKAQNYHRDIIEAFRRGGKYLALVVAVSLAGVGIDRAPDDALAGSQLGLGAYWIWVVLIVVAACSFWITRAARGVWGALAVAAAADQGKRPRGRRRGR